MHFSVVTRGKWVGGWKTHTIGIINSLMKMEQCKKKKKKELLIRAELSGGIGLFMAVSSDWH